MPSRNLEFVALGAGDYPNHNARWDNGCDAVSHLLGTAGILRRYTRLS